jgi:hypothetical protein
MSAKRPRGTKAQQAPIEPKKVVKYIIEKFERKFEDVAGDDFTKVYESFNTRKHWQRLLMSSTERHKNDIKQGDIDMAALTAEAHAELAWKVLRRPLTLEDILDTLDEVKTEACTFIKGDAQIDGLICEI